MAAKGAAVRLVASVVAVLGAPAVARARVTVAAEGALLEETDGVVVLVVEAPGAAVHVVVRCLVMTSRSAAGVGAAVQRGHARGLVSTEAPALSIIKVR